MTTYHQLLCTAGPTDAITDMALQMRVDLRRLGESEIFARSVGIGTESSVRPFQDLPPGRPTDVVIVHSSLGDPEMAAELLRRPERLVLIYHGIGRPSEPFTDSDVRPSVGSTHEGDELTLLSQRVSIAIAISQFDAGTLVTLGYTRVHVARSAQRPGQLARLPTDGATDLELDEAVGVSFVLSTSELLPEQCQHILLQALHVLQSVHRTELGLVLVGSAPDPHYAQALHELARGLRLRDVWFAGPRSGSSLATLHRRARAFSSASRHEDRVGLDPLEAMTFGVPTIVRDVGATAETLGRGALVLPHASGPLMFAEALLLVDQDAGFRSALVDAGFDRVREYSAASSNQSVAGIIEAAGLAS